MVLCLIQEHTKLFVLGTDVSDQGRDVGIQLCHIGKGGSAGNLGGDLLELSFVALVEGLVRGETGLACLNLKLLLMEEVLIYIVKEELKSGRNGGTALAASAGVHQSVDGFEQLTVFVVDGHVSGFQIFGQFVSHSGQFLSLVTMKHRF